MNKNHLLSLLTIILSFLITNAGVAQIKASVEKGCLPLVVDFSANNTNVKSYQWTFGNGQRSSLSNPTIIFEEKGVFDVSLSVTLNNNQVVNYSREDFIEVFTFPKASFTQDVTEICANTSVHFQNTSSGEAEYLWSFGDGNQSDEENPLHTYAHGGQYTVTLRVTGPGACEAVAIKEDVIEVRDPARVHISSDKTGQCLNGEAVKFYLEGSPKEVLWDFGDGTQSNELQPEHLYSATGVFAVSVWVLDITGCSQTLLLNDSIEVKDLAIPELQVSDTSVCTGEIFTLQALTDAEGEFQWTLSDGRSFEGKSIDLQFDEAGTYSAQLVFMGNNGCQQTVDFPEFVKVKSVQAPQIAYASFSGCAPFTFNATNNTSGANAFEWVIGGKTFSGSELTYTFKEAGEFSVKAITYYTNGCSIEQVLDNKIAVYKSESEVEVAAWNGCLPLQTELSLLNEEAIDVTWHSGDGRTFATSRAEIEYSNPGVFYPSVIYTNQYGCLVEYSFEEPVIVYDSGIFLNDPEVIESCTFTEVFFNGDMGYDFWEWNFGDGNTSTDKNPVHNYSDPGSYTISLTTNNKNGCRTTIENYNIIEIPDITPQATYEVVPGADCGLFSVAMHTNLKVGEKAYWYASDALVGTKENIELSFFTLKDVDVTLYIQGAGNCGKSKGIVVKNPWPGCEIVDPEEEEDDNVVKGPLNKHTFSSCSAPFEVDFINPTPEAEWVQWTFSDGTTSTNRSFSKLYQSAGNYTVDFKARFPEDSVLEVKDYITVNIETPLVDFDYQVRVVCDSFEVSFIPNNPDFAYYKWKVNNKSVSLTTDNKFYFERAGLYQVSLSASNQGNCEATNIKNIFIGTEEHAFRYSSEICITETFTATHNLSGFKSFQWDLGNGELVNTANLSYQFNAGGEYQIKLIATDFADCEHVFPLPQKVKVFNPIANFAAKGKTNGCGSLKVAFNNKSSGADAWLWDFGNGIRSTQENPTVEFEHGIYSVTLTAFKGNCSATVTLKDYIKVDELSSEFSFQQDQACLPVEVVFSDQSINAVSWLWDFGDGSTSTDQNPTHVFTQIPTKPVKLTVMNASGCSISSKEKLNSIFSASFEADKAKICEGNTIQFTALSNQAVSWNWDFGDDNISTEANPVHTYNQPGIYSVKLIAESATGCADTVLMQNYIEVLEITAGFSLKEPITSACVPVQVSFQNQAVGASSYHWDFGDGKTSTVPNPLHVYTSVGEFDVLLVVTNQLGCTDTIKKRQLIITKGPETKFSVEKTVICMPEKAKFTDLSANAVEWKWFFGDGNISTEQHPEHEYSVPGVYNVTLLAKNEDGCEQSYSIKNIKVLPTPEPAFDLTVSGDCYPVKISGISTSKNLQNPDYVWDFDDGTESKDDAVEHTYSQPGLYEVKLTIRNEMGCPVTVSHPVKILVRDTVEHEEAKVNSVWVESNLVSFDLEPYTYNNISHYNIWRKTTGGYELMKQLDPAKTTAYEDNTCRPQDMSHEYAFQAVSFCEDTVSISQIRHYNTLHLQKMNDQQDKKMHWNAHKGLPADNYRVFRKRIEEDQWEEVFVESISHLNFADNTELCPGSYQYKVASFFGNSILSVSNVIQFEVTDLIFRNQVATIKTTSVLEEGAIFTEWSVPEAGKTRIANYEIFRAVNGGSFEFYAEVGGDQQYFIDEAVDSKSNEYTYKVNIINDCAITTPESEVSNNVLLQKENQFRKYGLSWKAYKGWKDGVKKYILQRQNAEGKWETIEVLEGNKSETIIRKEDQ
ncbi:PKD domain-containing protein [Marivirga lumbricoides]